ncbi:hypothetical protein EJB05_23041, partial [Eragrostis curvula]
MAQVRQVQDPQSEELIKAIQISLIVKIRPVLDKVVTDMYTAMRPRTMVVADLGCSSGPNTLTFVSSVIRAIGDYCRRSDCDQPPDLQFFLNDTPSNDFNSLFRAIDQFKKMVVVGKPNARKTARKTPSHYVVGLAGSFYRRLFPRRTLPIELKVSSKTHMNRENIYITKTTPPSVVRMYQEQFDFSHFLKLRSEELVLGGRMLLTFHGRKNNDVFYGDLNHLYGLLGEAIQSLVMEGLVDKERLDSFNLPIYGPSVDEVHKIIKQSELFNINQIQLFESNWDPDDDSDGNHVPNAIQSGMNVAKCLRAVMEPLFVSHFGECILDKIFQMYARNVSKHLEKEKTNYSVIVVSLKGNNRSLRVTSSTKLENTSKP